MTDCTSRMTTPDAGQVESAVLLVAPEAIGLAALTDALADRRGCTVRRVTTVDAAIDVLSGDEQITPLSHGTGIGLWMVHLLVRESNGVLSFAENDPRGTVAHIRLPTK